MRIEFLVKYELFNYTTLCKFFIEPGTYVFDIVRHEDLQIIGLKDDGFDRIITRINNHIVGQVMLYLFSLENRGKIIIHRDNNDLEEEQE